MNLLNLLVLELYCFILEKNSKILLIFTSNGDWRRKQSNHKMGSVNENWPVSWAVWSVAFISYIGQIEFMMAHAGETVC